MDRKTDTEAEKNTDLNPGKLERCGGAGLAEAGDSSEFRPS